MDDLQESIRLYMLAAGMRPGDPESKPTTTDRYVLSGLGAALGTRYDLLGDPADLELSIKVLELATSDEVPKKGEPVRDVRPTDRTYLAISLLSHFRIKGTLDDLHRAVEALRRAVSGLRDGSELHYCRMVLAGALKTRFEELGQRRDLDEAIELGRTVIQALRAPRPTMKEIQQRLSEELGVQLRDVGASTELADALRPDPVPDRTVTADPSLPSAVTNLGGCLALRFLRFRDRADIDEAIDVLRAAADSAPGSDRPAYLTNLAIALRTRAVADVDEAVSVGEAAEATGSAGPDRLSVRFALAVTLYDRHQRTRNREDQVRALGLVESCVHEAPAQHPDRARFLLFLAKVLTDAPTADQADVERAVSLCEKAADTDTAPARTRAEAAALGTDLLLSKGEHDRALPLCELMVELLPRLAWRGLDRETQEERLSGYAGLASLAAACALEARKPQDALMLLERGRAVLWTQLLGRRGIALSGADTQHLARLSEVLDGGPARSTGGPAPGAAPAGGSARDAEARIAAALEWQRLTGTGDSDSAALELRGLYDAAGDGKVVVVNLTRWRSDALAVSRTGVQVIRLPELTADGTVRQISDYLRAADRFQRALLDYDVNMDRWRSGDLSAEVNYANTALGARMTAAKATWLAELEATLRWMWCTIAEPVLDQLEFTRTPDEGDAWPRLHWCPTGVLALLPLHAAGNHGKDGGGRTVLDRVVSSYMPTLRTPTRASLSQDVRDGGLLVVSVPDAEGNPRLPGVEQEVEYIRKHMGDGNQVTVLADGAATRERVCAELPRHKWVHFTCHGYQNLISPSDGGLILEDGTLTVAGHEPLRGGGQVRFPVRVRDVVRRYRPAG
ncbi:CHAT domain-containing protein [Streptomyces sp. PmtG]